MHTVLLAGLAGTGKTTAARILAPRIDAAVLDKDAVTRPLAEALCRELTDDPDDRSSEAYLRRVRPLEYACLMRTASDVTAGGISVVVAAPLLSQIRDKAWLSDLRGSMSDPTGRVWVVWVHADADTMRRRIIDRAASRDREKIAAWGRYVESLDLTVPDTADIVLDNSAQAETSLTEQVNAAGNRIIFEP